jgi:hypothetical protein
MPVISVSLNGDVPSMRTVLLRTAQLAPGVLCEVWAFDQMQLCVVERIAADGAITVSCLPQSPVSKPR